MDELDEVSKAINYMILHELQKNKVVLDLTIGISTSRRCKEIELYGLGQLPFHATLEICFRKLPAPFRRVLTFFQALHILSHCLHIKFNIQKLGKTSSSLLFQNFIDLKKRSKRIDRNCLNPEKKSKP